VPPQRPVSPGGSGRAAIGRLASRVRPAQAWKGSCLETVHLAQLGGFRWSLPLRAGAPRTALRSAEFSCTGSAPASAALPHCRLSLGRKRGLGQRSAEVANVATPIGIRNWAACAVSRMGPDRTGSTKGPRKCPIRCDCLCGLAVVIDTLGTQKMFGLGAGELVLIVLVVVVVFGSTKLPQLAMVWAAP